MKIEIFPIVKRFEYPHPYTFSPYGIKSGYKWSWKYFSFIPWNDVIVGHCYFYNNVELYIYGEKI